MRIHGWSLCPYTELMALCWVGIFWSTDMWPIPTDDVLLWDENGACAFSTRWAGELNEPRCSTPDLFWPYLFAAFCAHIELVVEAELLWIATACVPAARRAAKTCALTSASLCSSNFPIPVCQRAFLDEKKIRSIINQEWRKLVTTRKWQVEDLSSNMILTYGTTTFLNDSQRDTNVWTLLRYSAQRITPSAFSPSRHNLADCGGRLNLSPHHFFVLILWNSSTIDHFPLIRCLVATASPGIILATRKAIG